MRSKVGRSSAAAAFLGKCLLGAALLAGWGCEFDSYLNPSVTGYWEHTPTTVPILDRVDAIEGKTEEYVEYSQVGREDLIAEAAEYRLGPSDELEIVVDNFEGPGQPAQFARRVDLRGYISLPRLGRIYVLGKTETEVQAAVARAVQEAAIIVRDPIVAVQVVAQRQQTFSVIGGVRTPGSFFVSRPDFRLLEALTSAGGFDETVPRIYVIRQIPLSELVKGTTPEPPQTPSKVIEPTLPTPPDRLIDIIDDITKPKPAEGQPETPPPPPPTLAMMSSTLGSWSQPAGQPPADREPPIDLEDPSAAPQPPAEARPADGSTRSRTRWVFQNGQWVKSAARDGRTNGAKPPALPEGTEGLVAQRVIEIQVKPLIAGQSEVNIVVRPGDVIRVPTAEGGLIYVTGEVARPGTYGLPPTSKLTIEQAIISAGGLTPTAVPQRVDLTRRLPGNRQATIRLNLAAIAQRTQPDVYLKPDDTVNVGTDFWAYPLAVFRNGLRMSYGFGFVLDRNFSGDVFGQNEELIQ